jgi:polysaccharide export outer membrane protein
MRVTRILVPMLIGGFSPRAKKQTVGLTRNSDCQKFKADVPLNYPLRPGDGIVVKERWS